MKKKIISISGVTLIEILIGIVISVIMMAAMFTSYQAVNNTYSQVIDRAKISQTGRDIIGMLTRDIRMAGYTDFDAVQITEAVKITDSTSKCCDRIDIIYDRSSSERVKISYYVQQYNNRHRLFKKIDKCTKSDCSTTATLQSAQPIADYVEDLQFSGLKNGKVASTGAVEYGMGNKRWFTPDEIITIPWHGYQPWKVNECKKITRDMQYLDKKYKLNKTKYICGKKQKGGKKQFLYNPNNPKKSFDVYIDKNPKDTINIKYTTVNDV